MFTSYPQSRAPDNHEGGISRLEKLGRRAVDAQRRETSLLVRAAVDTVGVDIEEIGFPTDGVDLVRLERRILASEDKYRRVDITGSRPFLGAFPPKPADHVLPPEGLIAKYNQIMADTQQRAFKEHIKSRFLPLDRDKAVSFRSKPHSFSEWVIFYNDLSFQIFDKALFLNFPLQIPDGLLTREQFRDLVPAIESDSNLYPSMTTFLQFMDDSFLEDRRLRLGKGRNR